MDQLDGFDDRNYSYTYVFMFIAEKAQVHFLPPILIFDYNTKKIINTLKLFKI